MKGRISARRESIGPLSYQQDHIWSTPDGESYNTPPLALKMNGSVNETVLRLAVNAVVHRHEILRTSFREHDGRRIQVVATECDVPLELHTVPDVSAQFEAARIIREAAVRTFSISSPPLFRVGLIRLHGLEHIFFVVIHHIVSDLWSVKVFLRDLVKFYCAIMEDTEPQLSPLEIQYLDYVHWQRERYRDAVAREHVDYWRDRLKDAPQLELCGSEASPKGSALLRGAVVSLELPDALCARLGTASRAQGVTVYTLLLAVFQLVLSQFASKPDIVIDALVANRDRSEFEPLIGILAASVALRVDLSDGMTFEHLLRLDRDECCNAYPRAHFPFGKVARSLAGEDPHEQINRPRFLFAYQNAPVSIPPMVDVNLSPFATAGAAIFEGFEVAKPLWYQSWQVWNLGSSFRLVVIYQAERFSASLVNRMLRAYQDIAEIVAEKQSISVRDSCLSVSAR